MKLNINSKITKYFLDHARVTILALLALIIFGTVSLLSLKVTGFPSPQINLVIVNTVYPGASPNTVLEQVTKPLENSIKTVDGVTSYSSTSGNSVSTISVSIDDNANLDVVKTKIDSAVKGIVLPDGANNAELITPNFSGEDYFFALVRKDGTTNNKDSFNVLDKLRTDIEKDSEVNTFNVSNEIEKKIGIIVDTQKMSAANLSYLDITNQLQSWGLTLPVAQNAALNNTKYNILLSVSGSSIDDIKNIQIFSASRPGPGTKLEDIANVEYQYLTNSDIRSVLGYRDGSTKVTDSVPFSIDIVNNVDLNKYDPKIQKIVSKYFDSNSSEYRDSSAEDKALFDNYNLIKVFSVADSNKEQTGEVIAGMIGEKWNGLGPLKWVGLLFGGIQLVFIVMFLFVSWRTAIIAALALPLSFFFAVIWLRITGNDLNTLVLFSLVLVIGLVVDPALVVLESIQRNMDNGLEGKEAVLAAVREVGNGLFLSVLTSVLVFVPFGVVSGFFGAIISYIPLTIIPALIGSYIIPLVILSWLSSFFLKKGKHSSTVETENLWPIARGMISINEKILNAHAIVRLLIILVSIIVPFVVAGTYFQTGKVKTVQFAQQEDSQFLQIVTQNFPQKTPADLEANDKALITEIMANDSVAQVTPLGQGVNNTYYVELKEKSERKGLTASSISKDLTSRLSQDFKNEFFNVDVGVLSNGPPSSSFPVSIAVKTNDLNIQKNAVADLTKILNTICKKDDKSFELKADCSNSDKLILKVDNGYEGKSNKNVEVLLRRDKLALNPVNPIEVRTTLSNLFKVNDGKKVATFKDNGNDIDIILDKVLPGPTDIEQIKNVQLPTIDGRIVKLSDIADISEVDTVNAVRRVKGETIGVITAKPLSDFADAANVSSIQKIVIDEFNKSFKSKYSNDLVVENYSEGDTASITKSFSELGIAFLLAIILTYLVLVIFFDSFSQPLVILFSIPLTFLGIFPALAAFGGGQLGFLEIIGIIILVGLVENVAIFLIDAANQKIKEGWDDKRAIAYASGVRFRPIILTKLTTLVSTAPLAILSEQYRSLSVVIIFGLLTSGIVSLITSPILFVYFKGLSREFRSYPALGKFIFILLLPLAIIVMPLYRFSTRLMKK